MCTVITVHPSLVESILEKGLSNTTSFIGVSACQLQAVEHVFPTVYVGTKRLKGLMHKFMMIIKFLDSKRGAKFKTFWMLSLAH